MRINHKSSYIKLRVAEYPSLAEQVEALIEGGQKLADMKQRIAEIKAMYPKPTR